MTVGTSRRLLWLALIFLLPFPVFLGVITPVIPVARTLMLSGVCLLVVVSEGTRGIADLFAVMLFAQALCHMILLWFVASALTHLLARVTRERLAVFTLTLILAGLIAGTAFSLYRTPLSATSIRSNLLEVLE